MHKFITVVALLAVMNVASAGPGDDAVKRCRQIGDAAQRLACYDGIAIAATPAAAAPAPVAAAPAAAAAVAAKAPSKVEEFGLVKKAPAAETDVIDSQTGAAFDGWSAHQVITLSNGQKWQITDGSSAYLGKPSARNVKVRRGRFGTFFMEFEGLNQTPRVKRIE